MERLPQPHDVTASVAEHPKYLFRLLFRFILIVLADRHVFLRYHRSTQLPRSVDQERQMMIACPVANP